jgi:nucleoside-diphosphate-sugar epimerase
MKDTVLVIGGNGFIGKNLLRHLCNIPKYNVIAGCRTEPLYKVSGVNYKTIDLLDAKNLSRILRGVDVVIHLAGQNITANTSDNDRKAQIRSVEFLNISVARVLARSDIKKLIWLSSTTGYPASRSPLLEDDFHRSLPHERYLAVGSMYRSLETMFDDNLRLDQCIITLRPSAIYGEHTNYTALAPHILTTLIKTLTGSNMSGKIVYADPTEARDWLFAGDLALAIEKSVSLQNKRIALNVGFGKVSTMLQVHKELISVLGLDGQVKVEAKNFSKSEPLVRAINVSKSIELLGTYAKTGLRKGIKLTVDDYVSLKK